jgi:hypothetical protein
MGDKPAKYWDHREARWVAHAPVADQVVVPSQPQPETEPALTTPAEADVRSG